METSTVIQGATSRLYPTAAQAEKLEQWSGACRFLWNRLLARQNALYASEGKFLWRADLQKAAIEIKNTEGLEWLKDVPAHALLKVCANMDKAFRKFITERKAGRKVGFPKPKKKFVREAGVYCVNQTTSYLGNNRVKLPKLGAVKCRGWRETDGRLIGGTVTRRTGGGWLLSVQHEVSAPEYTPPTIDMVGVDLGIKNLATIYDGCSVLTIGNKRPLKGALRALRRSQRAVSRRNKGGKNRKKAAVRVATINRKVANIRKDSIHQFTHALTTKAGVIKVEDLNVKGMQRGDYSRALADVGMGSVLRQIAYKGDWRGRDVVKVDRFYPSSQVCSGCGTLHKEMKTMLPTLRCKCGTTLDRDSNAAINLFWYGEERRNRRVHPATPTETGDQAAVLPVPVVEVGMPTLF